MARPRPCSGIGVDGDAGEGGAVEPAQHREQIGRGLGEIAAMAEPQTSAKPAGCRAPKASRASPAAASTASRRSGKRGA